MHGAGKINTVKNLDFISLFLLQEIPSLLQHPAFWVYHHIGGMGLQKLGREPEPGLAGAGGPGVGGEKFRPGQNDVVLKLGGGERLDVFFRSP
mgnify:CR=1 FL=1